MSAHLAVLRTSLGAHRCRKWAKCAPFQALICLIYKGKTPAHLDLLRTSAHLNSPQVSMALNYLETLDNSESTFCLRTCALTLYKYNPSRLDCREEYWTINDERERVQ